VRLGALDLDLAAHSGRCTPTRSARGAALVSIGVCLLLGQSSAHARPEPANDRPSLTAADGVKRAQEGERAGEPVRRKRRPAVGSHVKRARLAAAAKRARAPQLQASTDANAVPEESITKPTRWLPANGLECIKHGRLRGFCEGPRRVPEPHGPAAQQAARLGMGQRNAAARLLIGGPPARWVTAAEPARSDKWAYPVENSRLLRGLGNVTRLSKNKQGGGPRSTRRKPHAGLDIGAAEGAPIRAAQSGVVVYSDNRISGYGNLVMVVHRDASVALYGHCRATYVFPGQQVERGQIIAEVGHTGYARGSHLHFEYRVDGRPKDPTKLFDARPTAARSSSPQKK
jgi:murein DD-endopeptidase MepM/ murein hydrolase activator NlpD